MSAPSEFDEPLIFVGGSDINWSHLQSFARHKIVAVDGGGNDLLHHGLVPNFVCGDFDSIEPEALARLQREGAQIIDLPDQQSTDFAKALARFQSPAVYAYGFLDGRIDHGLDALAQIAKFADRRIYLIGTEDIAFVFPPRGELAIAPATRVSFWTPGLVQIASSQGLKWSLDGLEITPASMSISNAMNAEALTIDYHGDSLIAIAPISAIQLAN